MNWSTVYVKGKEGFEKEVLSNLNHADIRFMPGSMAENDNVALYWVDDRISLRDFKKAIGGKTVFRYRLHFFTSLEEATREEVKTVAESEELTSQEKALVRKMTNWQEDQFRYKHSVL